MPNPKEPPQHLVDDLIAHTKKFFDESPRLSTVQGPPHENDELLRQIALTRRLCGSFLDGAEELVITYERCALEVAAGAPPDSDEFAAYAQVRAKVTTLVRKALGS